MALPSVPTHGPDQSHHLTRVSLTIHPRWFPIAFVIPLTFLVAFTPRKTIPVLFEILPAWLSASVCLLALHTAACYTRLSRTALAWRQAAVLAGDIVLFVTQFAFSIVQLRFVLERHRSGPVEILVQIMIMTECISHLLLALQSIKHSTNLTPVLRLKACESCRNCSRCGPWTPPTLSVLAQTSSVPVADAERDHSREAYHDAEPLDDPRQRLSHDSDSMDTVTPRASGGNPVTDSFMGWARAPRGYVPVRTSEDGETPSVVKEEAKEGRGDDA